MKEEILYLRKKYGGSPMLYKQILSEHPNIDLDGEELKILIGYYQWLNTFLDGDRSFETYMKKYSGR